MFIASLCLFADSNLTYAAGRLNQLVVFTIVDKNDCTGDEHFFSFHFISSGVCSLHYQILARGKHGDIFLRASLIVSV